MVGSADPYKNTNVGDPGDKAKKYASLKEAKNLEFTQCVNVRG